MKISDIKINQNRRRINHAKVKDLSESIKQLGLLNPVTVSENNDLIAGAHRIEACKLLGYTDIAVNIMSLDSLHCELAEIDENLIRNELTVMDRGDQLKRRKEIYETLYPETRAGIAGGKASGLSRGTKTESDFVQKPSFISDTSDKTGKSETVLKEEIRISKNIIPEVKEQIKDSPIANKKTDLLNLAKEPPEKQKEIANIVKKNDISVPEAKLLSKETPEKQKEILNKIEAGEAKTVKAALIQDKKQDTLKQEKKEMIIKPVVYHQDYKEFLNNIDDNSIDFLFTDPPYSTDIENINGFVEDWVPLALSKIKQTGRCFICIGAYPKEQQAYFNVLLNQDKFILDNPIIWTYRNTLGITPKMKYNLNYQTILHLYSEKSRPLNTEITNEMFSVMDISAPDGRQGNRFHTWQKPNELASRLIKHAMKKDETMIDCFACTGTFLIQGIKAGLKVSGCDISLDNLKIAEDRGCNIITGEQI